MILISLLYCYEDMDDWEIFNETSLPGKEPKHGRYHCCRLYTPKKSW